MNYTTMKLLKIISIITICVTLAHFTKVAYKREKAEKILKLRIEMLKATGLNEMEARKQALQEYKFELYCN